MLKFISPRSLVRGLLERNWRCPPSERATHRVFPSPTSATAEAWRRTGEKTEPSPNSSLVMIMSLVPANRDKGDTIIHFGFASFDEPRVFLGKTRDWELIRQLLYSAGHGQATQEEDPIALLVGWPVLPHGYCGIQCGRILFQLNKNLNPTVSQVISSPIYNVCRRKQPPICLWDPCHYQPMTDTWGREEIFGQPPIMPGMNYNPPTQETPAELYPGSLPTDPKMDPFYIWSNFVSKTTSVRSKNQRHHYGPLLHTLHPVLRTEEFWRKRGSLPRPLFHRRPENEDDSAMYF